MPRHRITSAQQPPTASYQSDELPNPTMATSPHDIPELEAARQGVGGKGSKWDIKGPIKRRERGGLELTSVGVQHRLLRDVPDLHAVDKSEQ